MKGEKKESAVASAMEAFQLSRANVFAAVRRAKARFRKLGISVAPLVSSEPPLLDTAFLLSIPLLC